MARRDPATGAAVAVLGGIVRAQVRWPGELLLWRALWQLAWAAVAVGEAARRDGTAGRTQR